MPAPSGVQFRFVLDYKIGELRKQLDPKDMELADMRTLLEVGGAGQAGCRACRQAWKAGSQAGYLDCTNEGRSVGPAGAGGARRHGQRLHPVRSAHLGEVKRQALTKLVSMLVNAGAGGGGRDA